jgi:hypothetical protein
VKSKKPKMIGAEVRHTDSACIESMVMPVMEICRLEHAPNTVHCTREVHLDRQAPSSSHVHRAALALGSEFAPRQVLSVPYHMPLGVWIRCECDCMCTGASAVA